MAAANFAAYNSSKAAVRHLTKSIALHCAREGQGVTCNAILPTFVDTPLLDHLRPGDHAETLAKLAKQIPLGRVARPAEIAAAAVERSRAEQEQGQRRLDEQRERAQALARERSDEAERRARPGGRDADLGQERDAPSTGRQRDYDDDMGY